LSSPPSRSRLRMGPGAFHTANQPTGGPRPQELISVICVTDSGTTDFEKRFGRSPAVGTRIRPFGGCTMDAPTTESLKPAGAVTWTSLVVHVGDPVSREAVGRSSVRCWLRRTRGFGRRARAAFSDVPLRAPPAWTTCLIRQKSDHVGRARHRRNSAAGDDSARLF
jgi:hypothetical protein